MDDILIESTPVVVLGLENDLIRPLCSLYHVEIIGPMIGEHQNDRLQICMYVTLYDISFSEKIQI